MNRSLRQRRAVLALSFLMLIVGAGLIIVGGGGGDSVIVTPPPKQPPARVGAWATPRDVTGGDPAADVGPVLAVGPNGAVTIAWERDGDVAHVEQMSNTSVNGAFGATQE